MLTGVDLQHAGNRTRPFSARGPSRGERGIDCTFIQSAPAPTCLRTALTHSTSPSTNSAPITPSTPSWWRWRLLLGPRPGTAQDATGQERLARQALGPGARTHRSCRSRLSRGSRRNIGGLGRGGPGPPCTSSAARRRPQRLRCPGPCGSGGRVRYGVRGVCVHACGRACGRVCGGAYMRARAGRMCTEPLWKRGRVETAVASETAASRAARRRPCAGMNGRRAHLTVVYPAKSVLFACTVARTVRSTRLSFVSWSSQEVSA